MSNRDIWDKIAIIIAINLLHKKFKYVTFKLLNQGGKKSTDKIQSTLTSVEAKFLSKKAVRLVAKLTYISTNNNQKLKIIVISENKWFNHRKMRYFRQDSRYFDYKLLNKKSTSNVKQDCKDSLIFRYYIKRLLIAKNKCCDS